MQGHVLLYARDKRWRRSVANALESAGHSYQDAGEPGRLRELVDRQRFDVLALRLRDEEDAEEAGASLQGARLPDHGVLVGSFAGLTLAQRLQRRGTYRYVPGRVSAAEVCRLVEASLSPGDIEDVANEHDVSTQIEEVDLEELFEEAAQAVYSSARRRAQRFNTVIDGPSTLALADRAKLRRVLTSLLKVLVTTAPRGAQVTAEARANRDEWVVRLRARVSKAPRGRQLAATLEDETEALAAASRQIGQQGGLLWVELSGNTAVGVCLTLPAAHGARGAAQPAASNRKTAHN